MVYKKYLSAIYGCAREHHISNEEIHEAISVGFNKTSLKDLTERECRTLLDGMRGTTSQAKRAVRGASGHANTTRGHAMGTAGRKDAAKSETEYLVSARELELLREAAELRGWSRETLDTFIRRQLGGKELRTVRQFNKVFWAIKAMNRRAGLTGKYDVPVARTMEAPI